MTSTVAQTAADRVTRTAGPANGTPCVLLMFGELALKGRKRASFAATLERNLRRALRAAGRVELQRRGSSILVMAPPDALPRVLEIATEMPGLSVVQPALRLEPSTEHATRAAVALLRGWPARSFAVRSRRR
jgi:tRNA uracil 4-sulfurtransferase